MISTINTYQSYGYILNKPDCLSWLLNVRGSELKYTPVFRALAIIKKNGKILIFSEDKIEKTIFKNNKNIQFYEYKFLKNIINNFVYKTFLIDPKSTSVKIFRMLKKNKKLIWKKPLKFDAKYLKIAHKSDYIDEVENSFPKKGLHFLDGDTIVSPGSKQASSDAVASIITAIDSVQNKEFKGFCFKCT